MAKKGKFILSENLNKQENPFKDFCVINEYVISSHFVCKNGAGMIYRGILANDGILKMPFPLCFGTKWRIIWCQKGKLLSYTEFASQSRVERSRH